MSPRALAVVALVAALLAVPAPPATSAHPGHPGHEEPAAFFDMFDQPHVKPKRIFLTANAGPWLKGLRWKGWGSAKTVAHGRYISDCASCVGPARRTATVTFTRPVECRGEGAGYVAYRKGVVRLSAPDEGRTKTRFTLPMGCP